MSRYKPRGWFGESHRHYLAAKGIKSKHNNPLRYFQDKVIEGVRNDLKGNRDPGNLKRAYAKGWSKNDLRENDALRNRFGVSLDQLQDDSESLWPRRTFPRESETVQEQEMESFRSLPVQDIPMTGGFEDQSVFDQEMQQPMQQIEQPQQMEFEEQQLIPEQQIQEEFLEKEPFKQTSQPVSQTVSTPGVPMRSALSEEL